eukprot:NODE_158_length_15065_cov_0.349125.p10 type:complete len:270 gc:universal NODE_158_length_15065_cov_0.349125:3428-2619(-)
MRSVALELLKNPDFKYDCNLFEPYRDHFINSKVFQALKHGMTNHFDSCKDTFAYFFESIIGEKPIADNQDQLTTAAYILIHVPMYQLKNDLGSLFQPEKSLENALSFYKHFSPPCQKLAGLQMIQLYNLVKVYKGYEWIIKCLADNKNKKMILTVHSLIFNYFHRFVTYWKVLQAARDISKNRDNYMHLYVVLTEPGFILMTYEHLENLVNDRMSLAIKKGDNLRIYWLVRIVREVFTNIHLSRFFGKSVHTFTNEEMNSFKDNTLGSK